MAGLVVTAVLALAPATASAAGLVAAYDRYVTGKGFEIGLVNALTGATLALPAGVNTNDDELHPTLTPDGRYLVFMRTKLLPKLNGDIVPPEARTLFVADRESGHGDVARPDRRGAGVQVGRPPGLGRPPVPEPGVPAYTFVLSPQRSRAARSTRGSKGRWAARPRSGLVETVHADDGSIPEFDNFSQQQQSVRRALPVLRRARPQHRRAAEPDVQFTTFRYPAGRLQPGGPGVQPRHRERARRPSRRAQRRLRRVPHGR